MTTTIPESAAPLLLGRYRPHTLIGRGGMASIFRAHDETLDRDVALKLFRAGGAADGESCRDQWRGGKPAYRAAHA